MSFDIGRMFRRALIALVMIPAVCAGAGFAITDTCSIALQGSVSGAAPAPVSVDGSTGNLAATGFAASSYVAGLGLCDPLPPGTAPMCTISASNTRAARGDSVTLFAKCPISTNSFTWYGPAGAVPGPNGPGVPTAATSSPSWIVKLTDPGAFSYAVVGSSSNGLVGAASAPVTILVGNATGTPADPPSCVLVGSPNWLIAGSSATLGVVCNPPQSSLNWDPIETGAPAIPASTLVGPFMAVGTFTYKVAGVNAVGTGPKASATFTVKPNASCTGYGTTADYSYPLPATNSSRDLTLSSSVVQTAAFKFAAGNAQIYFAALSVDASMFPSNIVMSVSATPGDFSATGGCFLSASLGPPFYSSQGMNITTGYGPGYCMINAGQTYYLNVRYVNDKCATTPACTGSTCTARLLRY